MKIPIVWTKSIEQAPNDATNHLVLSLTRNLYFVSSSNSSELSDSPETWNLHMHIYIANNMIIPDSIATIIPTTVPFAAPLA